MESFPVTKGWLFFAPIFSGALAVFGDGMNFAFGLIAVISLFFLFVEWFWNFKYVKWWAVWLKAVSCALVFAGFCVLFASPLKKMYNKSDEDLRVYFEFHGNDPRTLNIRYVFLNLGKQPALVSGVALFDVAGNTPASDPMENVELCEKTPVATLQFQQFTGNFLRFSVVPGATGALIYSNSFAIEGEAEPLKWPVAIDAGHTRIITATFEIAPDDKTKDTRVFCPVIETRDTQNVNGTAICRGISISLSLTPELRTSIFSDLRQPQLRLLPHQTGLPTCPMTSLQ